MEHRANLAFKQLPPSIGTTAITGTKFAGHVSCTGDPGLDAVNSHQKVSLWCATHTQKVTYSQRSAVIALHWRS